MINGKTKNSLGAGELARLAGVSSDTLRHYESKGVVQRPPRLANGYRAYPRETLERVRLVRRAMSIGFTLDELREILRVRDAGGAPCLKVRDLAAEKLAAVEKRLNEMVALRNELHATLKDWDARLARTRRGRRSRLLESLDPTDDLRPKPGAGFTTTATIKNKPRSRRR